MKEQKQTDETPEQRHDRIDRLMATLKIIESGYAGILPNGNIVDRQLHPTAIPYQKNTLFNTPEPGKYENKITPRN